LNGLDGLLGEGRDCSAERISCQAKPNPEWSRFSRFSRFQGHLLHLGPGEAFLPRFFLLFVPNNAIQRTYKASKQRQNSVKTASKQR